MCEDDDDFKYAVQAMELDDLPIIEGKKKVIKLCQKEQEALNQIIDVCYGRIKHINHHARILHILEIAENALKKY
jgi:hypothetical protein